MNPNDVVFSATLPSGGTAQVVITGANNGDIQAIQALFMAVQPRLPAIYQPSE